MHMAFFIIIKIWSDNMLNILKKIVSSLLSLILLLAITTICSIFVIRNSLSGDIILNILNNQNINNIDYLSLISDFNNKEYENINEYFDTKEITKELESIFINYLKYSSGIPDTNTPSTQSLKDLIKDTSSKYEQETGKSLNLEEINKQLDELEIKLAEKNELSSNNMYKKVFQFTYNNKYIYFAIAISIVCIIFIFLLNKLESLIKHLITVFLFNGIGNLSFGLALNKITNPEINSSIKGLSTTLTSIFNKIAIISFIIASILIVTFIAIKVVNLRKKRKELQKMENNDIDISENTILEENNISLNNENS